MSKLELTFGANILSRYKDLNYNLWYAIAEFVDNSSQSYLDNRKELDASRDENFHVKIGFENGKSFKIIDNAYGMDEKGLNDVLLVGGGIIPKNDIEELEQKGVGKLFGPGTPVQTTVDYIIEWVKCFLRTCMH